MTKAKPFDIPKREVWEAFKKVKANQGAAGVDGQSIADFEIDLKDNLYKLWNRLSSGSYLPQAGAAGGHSESERRNAAVGHPDGGGPDRARGGPPVSGSLVWIRCSMQTPTGPSRPLGDRRRAHGAPALLACHRVLDLDIKGFFDSIPHDLLLKALRSHTDCRWVLLYVERWLKAPVQGDDGCLEPREAGTPQGSVVSPILANLFLHYAFDRWMSRTHAAVPFERYADDRDLPLSDTTRGRSLAGGS